jgi:hypothetical protein
VDCSQLNHAHHLARGALRPVAPEATAQSVARLGEPEGGIYAANSIVAGQWGVPEMTLFRRVGYPSEVADLVERARSVLSAQPVEVREPITRQQLRESFHRDTQCTLGGDIVLAEKVATVVERFHGITAARGAA